MTHGDPKKPKVNPHPVKRYEVVATADAPGPWDAVSGYLHYEVVNRKCTPEDSFSGVHVMPEGVERKFEMTHVDVKTWRGYFYRDLIQDEDYYGLGVCHWDVAGVTPVFVVHGETFASARGIEDFLSNGPYTEYFQKSAFLERSSMSDSALPYLAARPEFIQHPDAFFPITVTVKEATP